MDRQIIGELSDKLSWWDWVWKSLGIAVTSFFAYLWNITIESEMIIYAVLIVCGVDWILGMARAIIQGTFETRKAFKIVIYLGFYMLLLYSLASLERAFITLQWLMEGVMPVLLIPMVMSILTNASRLGIIPFSVVKDALKKIDKYKDGEQDTDYE